jgi:hypothetical protein
MNLRHIDPRSIDWMDAMLDWEVEGRPKRERVGAAGSKAAAPGETETHPLLASQSASSELHPSRPPPGR